MYGLYYHRKSIDIFAVFLLLQVNVNDPLNDYQQSVFLISKGLVLVSVQPNAHANKFVDQISQTKVTYVFLLVNSTIHPPSNKSVCKM